MPSQDTSRSAFDDRKQYTRVHMQQGRVLVDDDWNEAAAIAADDQRRTRVDVIGPAGSPDSGFRIEALAGAIAAGDPVDFRIRAGTFYLGGLRLELGHDETLRNQADWLRVSASLPPRPVAQRLDLVYLEACEQTVTAAEDAELLEAALGGPDTTTRLRVVRRVGVVPDVGVVGCAAAWQIARAAWTAAGQGTMDADHELVSDARLGVTFVPGAPPADLCAPTVAGGYLGAENQAIRVELLGPNTLTWGFDNAAPVYRVALSSAGARVTLLTPPRDEMHWPLAGQIVEIIPWGSLLPNGEQAAERQGHFARVLTSFDPDQGFFEIDVAAPNVVAASVQPPVPGGQTWGFGEEWKSRADRPALEAGGSYAYLRVWNRGVPAPGAPPPTAAVPYLPGAALTLGGTGVAVTITGNARRAGDHWIIAARPRTPDQVVPWELRALGGRAAHGVRRFRAPLGIIRWTPAAANTLIAEVVHDCRLPFHPLTRLQGCCRYRVGDELRSFGDFTSIQAAVNALPAEGGEICVLPGEYRERVLIANRTNVEIHGCGPESRVVEPAGGAGAVITVSDSQGVTLRGLGVEAPTAEGVRIEQTANAAGEGTVRVRLEDLSIAVRDLSGIMVRGGRFLTLLRNRVVVAELASPLAVGSDLGRWAGITLGADDVLAELNTVTVLPTRTMPTMAFGGIQLLGLSDRIELRRNSILRGTGNGITLGSTVLVPAGTTDPGGGGDAPGGTIVVDGGGCVHIGIVDTGGGGPRERVPVSAGSLNDIRIVDNDIEEMGANGIGVVQFFDLEGPDGGYITVDRLTIDGNRIRRCLRLEPLEPPPELWAELGHGGIALADGEHVVIRENRIERNGRSHLDPVCGIFVLRAEGLIVEANQVLDNGTIAGEGTMAAGHRGGIVVVRASPGRFLAGSDVPGGGDAAAPGSALHALRIHDNVVVHPIGRALTAMGCGAMSIQNNQLTSRGTNAPNIIQLVIQLFQLLQSGSAGHTTGTGGSSTGSAASAAAARRGQLMLLLLELVSGRAVSVIDGGLSPEFFMLIGYAAQSKTTMVPATGIAGSAMAGLVDAKTGGVLVQLAALARAGGNILFHDNHVRFDPVAGQQVLALASVVLLSLDEVTCHDNHLDCILPRADFMITNLAAGGWSVGAQANRMKEFPVRALLSAATFAMMNNTSGNQGTHCFYVNGISPALRVSHSNRSFMGALLPDYCRWLGDTDPKTPTPAPDGDPV